MRIREQIATTVDPTISGEMRAKAKSMKVPLGTLLEDAWLYFKGEPTPLTLARRQMVFPEPAKKRAA